MTATVTMTVTTGSLPARLLAALWIVDWTAEVMWWCDQHAPAHHTGMQAMADRTDEAGLGRAGQELETSHTFTYRCTRCEKD